MSTWRSRWAALAARWGRAFSPLLLLAAASDPRASSGLPLEPARTVAIDTTTGTFIALDVTPDARTLVFDLLGDLYLLPAAGGRARQVSAGLAYDTQPVVSPDGRSIAFVSDRSGADNIWIARIDGSHPRQVSVSDDDTVLVQPAWSADGRAIYASRYRADLNNYELWRYPLAGDATLVVPIRENDTAPRSTWRSTLGAAASRDGRWLYYARRVGGLDFDEVNAWTIVRRYLATGTEQTIVSGSGARGAARETYFAPAIAPDGATLAYATRLNGRTVLRLRSLASGEDGELATLDPDLLQASSWQGAVPRYAFAPDGRSLFVSRRGGIERIALDGNATPIPFSAHMRVALGRSTRVAIREETGPVVARLIQAPAASWDGRRLAFGALGSVWTRALERTAEPLKISGALAAAQPGWSPDGRQVVFVSWDEADGGQLWSAPADGSASPRQVTRVPAFYTYPTFTPDGATLLAVRSPAAVRQATNFEYGKVREAELVAIDIATGATRVVASGRLGGRPHFAADPHVVHLLTDDGLAAFDLRTGERRLVAQVTGPGWYFQDGPAPAEDLRISPDGKWLAALVVQQVYLMPLPALGVTIDLDRPDPPARRLTRDGADAIEFGGDGTIGWSLGASFHRVPLAAALRSQGRDPPKPETTDIRVEVPRATPAGTLVLRGARVLTMANGDQIVPDADVVIAGGRIAAVGPRGSVAIPPGATIRDVGGKTILPGFVDEHDHIGEARRDVLAFANWGLAARLAYGITTSFDPSTLSLDQLAYQDMIDAGLLLGPRLRSTGPALFSMQRLRSLDDARALMRRYGGAYRLGNIKEYRTGNRRQRQWIAIAAREAGLQPTTEGALSLKLDLSQILDGFAGSEHALPAVPLGGDVLGLLRAQHTGYSATLLITNSGFPASDWLAVTRDPVADAKLRRFWPPAAIAQKLGERVWHPLSDQRFPAVAAEAGRVVQEGGLVGMGSHGELPGIGLHYEMQAHATGGMAPMAILHAATAGSAEVIGRLGELGTIEPGKFADLVILDADPLLDVANTLAVAEVMRGGVLYSASSLAELWPAVSRPASSRYSPGQPVRWLPVLETRSVSPLRH